MRERVVTRSVAAYQAVPPVAVPAENSRPTGQFPLEIWCLVFQDLAAKRDLNSLFQCSLVCRTLTEFALQELYLHYEFSPACNTDLVCHDASVCLWRSIIGSARDSTLLFPYCTWVQTLELGKLKLLLEDLSLLGNKARLKKLFSPPLQDLCVPNKQSKQAAGGFIMDETIIRIGTLLSSGIKAARTHTSPSRPVQISRIDAPTLGGLDSILSSWVSGLSRLRSLTLGQGVVVDGNLAEQVAMSCPEFRELACFYCYGGEKADSRMADFVRGLRPHTLQTFRVISLNELGQNTFRALTTHSRSLKQLEFSSISIEASPFVGCLKVCNQLESLILGSDLPQGDEHDAWECWDDMVLWLRSCLRLKHLALANIPEATKLVIMALKDTDIRLTSIDLNLRWDLDISPGNIFFVLSKQTELESLSYQSNEATIETERLFPRVFSLVDVVECCPKLRLLNSNEPFLPYDMARIRHSAPNIEELLVGFYEPESESEVVMASEFHDDVLVYLAQLSRLRQVVFQGFTVFSYEGLCSFVNALANDPHGAHDRLQITMLNQDLEARLEPAQEAALSRTLYERFGGRFEIQYTPGNDELHESDFSD